MKKIFLIVFSVLALSFVSCEGLLETEYHGGTTLEDYFETDAQAIDYLKRLYYEIPAERSWGRDIYWEQAGANDMVYGRSAEFDRTLAYLDCTGNETLVAQIYRKAYSYLAQAQYGIQRLEEKKAGDKGLSPVEECCLGELYFHRAFWHFTIAYRYGKGDQGVPYKPWEEYEPFYNAEMMPQQESVTKNYEYIIADLEKAEELLPWSGSIEATWGPEYRGRAHKAAAAAYIARINAFWATWDDSRWDYVIEAVNRLEQEYGRDLNPSFSDLYSSDFAKFWNKECCFSSPSTGGYNGGPVEFGGIICENGGFGKFNGWGWFKPTLQMYREMAKDNNQKDPATGKWIKNERLAKTIIEVGDHWTYFGEHRGFYQASDIEVGFAIGKYYDALKHEDPINNGYLGSDSNWPCTRVNFHWIRFAECLLLRAEANMNLGDFSAAAKDINRVRERSGLTPLPGDATWYDLYHERRCELAFEMTDHLHDIKRWAHSSYGVKEIQDIAIAELTVAPLTRRFKNRLKWDSELKAITIFENYSTTKYWCDNKIALRYPSEEIAKSGSEYKNIDYDAGTKYYCTTGEVEEVDLNGKSWGMVADQMDYNKYILNRYPGDGGAPSSDVLEENKSKWDLNCYFKSYEQTDTPVSFAEHQ